MEEDEAGEQQRDQTIYEEPNRSPQPAKEPLQVALPSLSKLPLQLLASQDLCGPHVLSVGLQTQPAKKFLQVA